MLLPEGPVCVIRHFLWGNVASSLGKRVDFCNRFWCLFFLMEIKRVLNGEESILEFCYSRNPDLFGMWQLTEHIWMIFSPLQCQCLKVFLKVF